MAQSSYVAPSTGGGGSFISFVKPQYRKDYQMPVIPWQRNGIRSFCLWNSAEQVLRIMPGHDKQTGEIFRQNIKCTTYAEDGKYLDYLSDTFMDTAVVDWFGDRGQTFITSYKPGSPEALKYGGDTVIDVFAKAIIYSVSSENRGKKGRLAVTDDFRRWAAKDGNLSIPKRALMFQALTFKINGKPHTDANKMPLLDENGEPLFLYSVCAVNGQDSMKALLQALVSPMDPRKSLDAATNNKYGALAELEGNLLYLHPVQEGKYNVLHPSVQAATQGWNPEPFPIEESCARDLWVPWEDLLYYMTPTEQAQLLAKEYGADTVNYVLAKDMRYRDFELPPDIAAAGYGRYAQFMDGTKEVRQTGYVPQAQAPAQARQLGGLGMRKPAGLGVAPAPAQQPPAEAPAPEAPQAPAGMSALRPNSTMDISQIQETMNRLRGNSGQPSTSDMASTLAQGMEATDFEDIQ